MITGVERRDRLPVAGTPASAAHAQSIEQPRGHQDDSGVIRRPSAPLAEEEKRPIKCPALPSAIMIMAEAMRVLPANIMQMCKPQRLERAARRR